MNRRTVLRRKQPIALIKRAKLTTDFDQERLRCWPVLSAARAEVLVAKVMCCALVSVALGLLNALQVTA